ncbi:MAG: heme-binding domain-containing protein [Actinomycetes bacterium]
MKQLLNTATKLLKWLWTEMKKYKVASSVVIAFALVFLVIGVLIGMPPLGYIVITTFIAVPTVLYVYKHRNASTSNVRLMMVFFAATIGTLVVIQAIPYGKDHTNPPITGEPEWSSPRTRELMVRACFGCHSNEVEYPSYASVAPISWVVQSHIDEGRSKVNYQEWNSRQRGAHETIEVIKNGSMPPSFYTTFGRHPEAKLTQEEISELIAGLRATPGFSEGH